jgi:hypothetical protein
MYHYYPQKSYGMACNIYDNNDFEDVKQLTKGMPKTLKHKAYLDKVKELTPDNLSQAMVGKIATTIEKWCDGIY